MSIIGQLAFSLNRRDEVPNQELAKQIADSNDRNAVKELTDNLHNKNKGIQNDCIKVLYEIGVVKPSLIVGYLNEFVELLDNGNQRLQWGAMTALSALTLENPKKIYSVLSKIINAPNKGSVITRDNCVNILIKLCSVKQYADHAFSLLIEQLLNSPVNQLAMYAERAMVIINGTNKSLFIKTLESRLGDFEKATKRKRVEKVIKSISKIK